MDLNEKREAVLEAAATVFSQYGFRRASMSAIAAAAGISRPTLYQWFENKAALFRQLANHRQNQAIAEAASVLTEPAPLADRVPRAILAYERIYYEPVAGSPHAAEFLDLNQGAAASDMIDGRYRLIAHLAVAIDSASGGADAPSRNPMISAPYFAELLMSAVNGVKSSATSIADFRQKIADVTDIFMVSIGARPPL